MSKKILLVLSILLTLGVVPKLSFNVQAATCTTTAECDSLINDAQDQISDLKEKESNVQNQIDIVEGDMGTTIQKISETENSISDFETKIKLKENEITTSENQIKELEGQIKELKEVVAQRMRVSQRLSRANTILQILSESDSLVDLIRQLRVINHFAESDSESMDELSQLVTKQQTLLSTLKVQKEELAASKSELETQRSTLQAYQTRLEEQKTELAKQMQELESERLSASEIIAIAEEQKEILQQTPPPEVNTGGNSGVNSGAFMIPLARGYVSCEFMCYTNHTGIDLANYGDTSTPVYAATDGTVIRAGWHSAYGNHVMITHNVDGQTITTVYAHMYSSPYVSVGQTVSKGTQLGTMGNTGNSFGAHLHFEIYEGYYNYPYAVNPRKYINFPSSW